MFEVVAGRYVLIDSIGSGGSGEVWRAFDRKRGEYCAAKVIRRPEAATLVRAVFEQGVRLDHPHVVTPYAWAADDEQVLLAMPLVRGGSLAVLLRDLGMLPARYGAEVLRQLLVGLEHVHAAGLVHRDVKPANVLLEPTGTGAPHARLADFGLVLNPDRPRITGTFMVVGTPDYLAPESLEHGDQGVAQDLYAAGLVGAEMVGPFAGPLTGLIAELTAQEPARRPQSATAALERLARLLDGWPLRTPVPMPESDEPVEVFEQIGELPPGWGPRGPIAEAETVTVEALWSPEPAVGEAGILGADQQTIPVAGVFGEWPGQGSQVGGRPGEVRVAGPQAGDTSGELRGEGSAAGGWPGERPVAGPQVSGASGELRGKDSQVGSEPGDWQVQTVPLGGRPGGGAPGDWQTQTVPLGGGGSGGGPGGAPGDWQSRTVPLAGSSHSLRQPWNPADASAPSVSRHRWQWAAMLAAAVVVIGVLVAVVH